MSNLKKSQYGKSLSTFLRLFFLLILTSPVAAVDLPFDPNDFTFLVYNTGGYQAKIVDAMEKILDRDLEENEIRTADPGKHVTPNDLATHDILIVGWNWDGDTSGLNDETLAAGITGRVILSGHDLDYHTVDPDKYQSAAETMLIQAIDWVLKGDGMGMITLGCSDAFPYLPESWDVNAYSNHDEDVNEFTAEGLASGVYDGLEPDDMSDWNKAYHNIFTIEQISLFVPFELGGFSGSDIISIARDKIKLPRFYIYKEVNDVNCVSPLISEAEHELLEIPYNWLYYNIEYDANGFADTNVIITDYLPVEVDYYSSSSSDPCGLYDSNTHTVTWNIGDISASDSNDLWIQVGVNHYARPGYTITNYCEMEGDQYRTLTRWPADICCYGGNIIYVDADANGFNNGTSWLDAYKDLEDSFLGFRNCDCNQIWVAKGTYKPNERSGRASSFELFEGVALYGGFAGNENSLSERSLYDPNNFTILSGDIRAPNDHNDNSYNVVKCQDVNNAVLDGFTITAGNASYLVNKGGGIYCKDSNNLTVRNCVISQNETAVVSGSYGGGIYFKDSTNLAVTDCNFSDNTSYLGGALYNESSDLNINNCIFSNNLAKSAGGAIYNINYSELNITNCIFTGNIVELCGGGIYSDDSALNVTNCVFAGNIATEAISSGGGIYNINCPLVAIADCIFTGNSAHNYGGGVCSGDSTLNVTNCIFTGNNASNYGGGMHNYHYSSVAVANCIFSGNWAGAYGGGIASYDNISLALTNCTVSGNAALYGGGIFSWSYADTNLTNCIFWGNEAAVDDEICKDASSDVNVTYSDVKGGWEGDGNIDEDPCFFDVEQSGWWTDEVSYDNSTFQTTLTDSDANWAVNELAGKFINPDTVNQDLHFFIVSNDVNTIMVWSDVTAIAKATRPYQIYDYHLTADSACIDAGDPNVDYTGQTDIDGEPRVFDGDYNEIPIVDMGADEYYWSPADFISDGLVNFFDYAIFADSWLTIPTNQYYNEICDLVDNNCIDSNDLARFCEDWLWQTAWTKTFPFAYEKTMGRSMGKSMAESLDLTQDLFPSVSAKQDQPKLTEADIEEILKWLAELWLTDEEVRKMISEEEWLKFIESVIQALKEGI